MKDSGIKWIGLIPQNWKVTKIKHHLKRNEPRNPGDCIVLSLYRELGIVPKDSRDDNHNVTSLDTSNYKYVRIGDFVINKMKAWQGSVAVSDYEGIVSPAYYVYNFLDDVFDKRYFHYLLRSCYKDEFRRLSGGIREGQWDLSSENFDNTLVLIPPLAEQRSIAVQIDRQCAHIDNIIEKTKASIEEYKKLRQAVITQAVTKGVRGDRPMKDSGIEWVGSIPVEWESVNPKALFTQRKDKAKQGEKQLTASQQYGVIYQDEYMEITGNKVVTVEKDFDILKHVEAGDFVISMRSFQGGLEYSTKTGSISSAYVMLIPNLEMVFPRYYKWLLKSAVYINALQSTSNMVRDGQAMRYSNFAQIKLYTVPMFEQEEIADYLDEKCSAIDTLIQQKEQFLTELESYKKSMIYEYVTGKKEVPTA